MCLCRVEKLGPRTGLIEKAKNQTMSLPEELASFTYDPAEFKNLLEIWTNEGWPVQLLMRDHLSAKLLKDNDVFNLIKFFKHEWKWDDEDGFFIMHKKSSESPLELE